jgi:hypothetical protein
MKYRTEMNSTAVSKYKPRGYSFVRMLCPGVGAGICMKLLLVEGVRIASRNTDTVLGTSERDSVIKLMRATQDSTVPQLIKAKQKKKSVIHMNSA